VECLSDVSAQRTRDLLERSRALAGSDEERSVLTNCINILDQALAARRRRPQ